MCYRNGITAAIMERRIQTGLSASDIKKTMQENDFADRKWMNAMFLSALNRMVANGTLIKIKDTYTLTEQTIESSKEIIKQTIKTPSKQTIETPLKQIIEPPPNESSKETIKQTIKPSNETINAIKGNLHQTIKNRTSAIVNKGRNQQTMSKQTMNKQTMQEQTMSKRTMNKQTMQEQTMSEQTTHAEQKMNRTTMERTTTMERSKLESMTTNNRATTDKQLSKDSTTEE